VQAKGTKSTVVPFSHADKDHVALASLLLSDGVIHLLPTISPMKK
jgi:hypothetical protein